MNAYFQLVLTPQGTAIRLVPATDGGKGIVTKDLIEYLQQKNIEVIDVAKLYQEISDLTKEVLVLVNNMSFYPVQETMILCVSEDKMTVIAKFYPPSNQGKLYSKNDILNDLQYNKVVFGIDLEAIDAYIKKRNYCEDIVIAKGLPAVEGKNASIEYFFETDLGAKPKRNEDGSVDFFSLNTINHCKAGDVLAKLHKEVLGTFGSNIFGERIKPKDVKKLILKHGKNIELTNNDCIMKSLINGHVCLTQNKVFVSDIYTVENVGTATGNVESIGSVLVNGNVQAGFSIKAEGNVEVRGVVEGATIEAGGDIIIARGMNGMGKGVLKAEGRVILKYAENATIIAGEYVESDSILHSNVSAKTEVNVDGKKGFIVGGSIKATNKISCKTLGSSMGSDTIIEVGIEPEQNKKIQIQQKEVIEIQKSIAKIQLILANATQRIKSGEKLSEEQLKYIQSLAFANKQQSEQLAIKQKELEFLDEMFESKIPACICVQDVAFPGSKITIGEASMMIKKSIKFCKFICEKGDIKVTSYQ